MCADGRIRFEYATYMGAEIQFLNPERKSCGFKSISGYVWAGFRRTVITASLLQFLILPHGLINKQDQLAKM